MIPFRLSALTGICMCGKGKKKKACHVTAFLVRESCIMHVYSGDRPSPQQNSTMFLPIASSAIRDALVLGRSGSNPLWALATRMKDLSTPQG